MRLSRVLDEAMAVGKTSYDVKSPYRYYVVTTWSKASPVGKGAVSREWQEKWGKPTKQNFKKRYDVMLPARVEKVELVRSDGKVLATEFGRPWW